MKLSLLFFHIVLIFTITACGYKTSGTYAKEQLDGKIFVNLLLNLQDPRNAVLIKDAVSEIIANRLDSKLVYDRNLADTVLDLKLKSVKMEELQYDEEGYNKLYKAIVVISVNYKNKYRSESFEISGDYDFSIDDETTITDTKRFEAIKNASSKALEEMISKLAINSFKK